MRTISKKARNLLFSVGALLMATTAAQAYPVILTLENVAFSDGGTASGNIVLNVYGYVTSGEIKTTTGTLLQGRDYVFPSNPSSGYSAGVFSGFAGAYNLVLYLDVAHPFSATMSGVDAITGGCETHSFATTCVANSNTRLIVLADNPELVVPEPVSLALLGGGLLALGAIRKHKMLGL